ncbi:MAG: hypothetical protein U9N51_04400 [Bacteroidota bacterium]|nr:hypothetical protein [Bacteroidota bacterium]
MKKRAYVVAKKIVIRWESDGHSIEKNVDAFLKLSEAKNLPSTSVLSNFSTREPRET